MLVYGLFTAVCLLAHEALASGKGGAGTGGIMSVMKPVKEKGAQLKFGDYESIVIDSGSPNIVETEGIYVYLDETSTWQVRWLGDVGMLVSIKLNSDNPIHDVINWGSDVNAKLNKKGNILTVTGVTGSSATGVSFKCETAVITFDAKWDMKRTPAKVKVSALKISPAKLPFNLTASVYKGLAPKSVEMPTNSQGKELLSPPAEKRGGYGSVVPSHSK
jgi:hypothetical protein